MAMFLLAEDPPPMSFAPSLLVLLASPLPKEASLEANLRREDEQFPYFRDQGE